MIDTIVFRLHNIDEYDSLVLSLSQGKKAVSRYIKGIDSSLLGDGLVYSKMLKFHESGNTIPLSHSDSLLSSSHYKLAYRIVHDRNYIEFNFSIPKFLFGTNIFQFVPHKGKYYHGAKSSVEYQHSILKERLDQFTSAFWKKYISGYNVDVNDLEINRIDICFNQIFQNEREAKYYFEHQKRIKKKYSRNSVVTPYLYADSIFYKSQDWSFKIYRKGVEFKKHDRKELIRINKETKKQIYDVDLLQETANKILRYECTFRSSFMSKIYFKEVFRHDDLRHRILEKSWKKIHNLKTNFTTENEEKYKHITSEEKQNHKDFTKLKSGVFKFFWKRSEGDKNFYTPSSNYHDYDKNVRFSKTVLNGLLEKFWKEFNHFQLSDKVTNSAFSIAQLKEKQNFENWEKYKTLSIKNKVKYKKYKRLYSAAFLSFLSALELYTLDELKSKEIYPLRTFYRYRSELNLIAKKNAVLDYKIDVSKDFFSYYRFFLVNKKKFKDITSLFY